MRKRTLAIATLVLVPAVTGGFILQERQSREGERLFGQVLGLVSARFVDTVGAGGLYERAARGLVHELNDPYTVLFSPKDLASFQTSTNGRYGGIGMQIEEIKGAITVNKVFPNTPAEEAGIREGDRIVQVDTASTRGWKTDQVSNTLKGTPGTKVNVKFQRPGVTEPIAVKFTRAIIHIPAVRYGLMLDGNVGYIPVDQFNETATEEVETQIRKLMRQGARSVVLDMRDNPGGILDQAIAMSNLFLREGQEVASVRGRGGMAEVHVARERPVAPDIPLIVLTDGGTASAAEIVAGSLQDHDRALVLGTTSFGKGLVQTLFPLDGGYALKMTTAKWYTPSGRSIQKERKVVDGRFVNEDTPPDSMESDSVRKARPAYKSDQGRTIYGGGGITPDVFVKPDTISTAEQAVLKAIFAKLTDSYAAIADLALEVKGKVPGPDFSVQPQWREDLYRRLTAAGVQLDRKQWELAAPSIDRLLRDRVAKVTFGDSTVKRLSLKAGEDRQLDRALDLLRKARTQQELLQLGSRMQTASLHPDALPAKKEQ
jgi:carboxyl-terminal processing protease